MLEMLLKSEVWRWYGQGYETDYKYQLKGAQDAYILGRLGDARGKRILEVGGGQSRVLARLAKKNECWNAEPYEGVGQGPTSPVELNRVKNVPVYLGQFSPELPDSYFDVVFSISVVEHITDDQLETFFRDCARILKPGGLTIHAIDIYLFDDAASAPQNWIERVRLYRSIGESDTVELECVSPPQIDETLHFRCAYASNSDYTMYQWNTIAPKLKPHRMNSQCCSIKMELVKPEGRTLPETHTSGKEERRGVMRQLARLLRWPVVPHQEEAPKEQVLESVTKTGARRFGNRLYADLSPEERAEPATIIYQMGKVGSRSIYWSLLEAGYRNVHHVHYFRPGVLFQRIHQERTISDGVEAAMFLWHPIFAEKRPARFITAVREPISRNFSGFFQNYTSFCPADEDGYRTPEENARLFLENYAHKVPLDWFPTELNPTLGIDVFEHPFPIEEGYQRLSTPYGELLILKLEAGREVMQHAIAEFLELDEFQLTDANVSTDKEYAEAYRAFKERIVLPVEYVNEMVDAQYTRHFYSPEERERVRQKWLRRLDQQQA